MEGWDCCPTDVVFLCSAHRGPWDVPEQKATHHTTRFGRWKPRLLSLPRNRSNPITQKVLGGRSIVYNCILLCITYDLPQMRGLCSFHSSIRGPGGLYPWQGCHTGFQTCKEWLEGLSCITLYNAASPREYTQLCTHFENFSVTNLSQFPSNVCVFNLFYGFELWV